MFRGGTIGGKEDAFLLQVSAAARLARCTGLSNNETSAPVLFHLLPDFLHPRVTEILCLEELLLIFLAPALLSLPTSAALSLLSLFELSESRESARRKTAT